jgi:uncharacterized glyoxalase superfamily protein PhnB
MAEAISFYRGLGFDVTTWDEQYAWVHHGGHEVLHLRLASDLDRTPNPSSCYLNVVDADAWHTSWSADGVALGPIDDRPWRMREFSLRDPGGNLIRVGHNL